MIVGSIKENTTLEKRVSITPESAKNIIALGLKVYISNKKNNSGKITIEYKDLEQFDFISDLLTKN